MELARASQWDRKVADGKGNGKDHMVRGMGTTRRDTTRSLGEEFGRGDQVG